uniref:Uncharacterized protein n=1 Tax=Arundo donax TaxID=35708 RepID=A0A0A9EY11_ARUDO
MFDQSYMQYCQTLGSMINQIAYHHLGSHLRLPHLCNSQ